MNETVRGRHIAGLNTARDDLPPKTLEFLRLLAAQEDLQLDIISGGKCWSALQNALRSGRDAIDALKLLLAAGVDLCKPMDDGRTALHLAAEWCLDGMPLEYLLSVGCKEFIDKQDQWGWTALHYAAISRNSAISSKPFSKVKSLLRSDADISIVGRRNPRNHYPQPERQFNPLSLLEVARPSRYDLLLSVLRKGGISVEFQEADDEFWDAPEML